MKAIKKIKEVIKAKETPVVAETPKKPASGQCACGHESAMHYGSEKNWCNLCTCLEYVKK